MDLSEEMKKVFLAGVGAVAVTAEKSKELLDQLVAKGELSVEQGKVLNEELKRKAKDGIQKAIRSCESSQEESSQMDTDAAVAAIVKNAGSISPEQLQALRSALFPDTASHQQD